MSLCVYRTNAQGVGPGGVSANLEVWLKADAGTSTTTDGATMTQWNNQVALSTNHATQAGTGDFATYSASQYNFYPAVYFPNGDNGYFDLDLDGIKNTDYNLITVLQRDNSNGNNYLLGTNVAGGNQGLHYGFRSNTRVTLAQYGNDIDATISRYDDPAAISLVHGELDQSSGKIISELRDGSTTSNSHGNTNPLTGTGTGRLGRGFGNDGFEGYVSEVIAYSSTLTVVEKNKIYSYLAIKYGFTLDNSGGGTAGDYTSSVGTLLWDADVNATYHNDVNGIGRDDNSGLDQQKSLGSNEGVILMMDKGGAFGADDDFILWGSDGLGSGVTTTNANPSYTYVMDQTWKAAVAGTPGTVSVSFVHPNNGVAADYGLLLDGVDNNFSTGATVHTTGVSINGDTITFTGVTITDGMFITLGTNYALPSPGGVISDLEIWLKADAGTSTTTDGATIAQWNNQISSSNHATQAGSGDFATYASNQYNFNPSVYFTNGDNGYFDLDLDVIKDTDYNLITVVERDNSNGESYLLGTDIGAGNQGLHYGYRNNSRVTLAQYGNDIDATIPAYNNPAALSLVHGELDQTSGKTISELRDGATISNSHTNTASLTGTGNGRLGRGFNTNGFEGYVSEVIAYSSTLTAIEKNKIYSYLAIKYGFTLDNSGGGTAGDYTSSFGTLLWDADVNSTYHKDVTGIGRDDNSGLDQQRSLSSNDGAILMMNKGGTFGANDDFILWGNDGLGHGVTTTNANPAYLYVMDQTWKASVSGTPGTVSVSFVHPNNGVVSDYGLLLDGVDNNFSVGATVHTTGASINGDTITFTGVSIADGMFFTLGTNYKLPSPGGVISNLKIWLKANDGTSTTTDGAAVANWSNRISSANTATQAGSGNFPTYRANRYNFNPSVYFANGDNGYFDLDLDVIKNTDYNLIAIVERDNSNGGNYFLGTDIGAGNQGLHYGFRNNTQATLAQYGNDVGVTIPAYNNPAEISLIHGELDQSSGKTISELRNTVTLTNSHANTAPLTGSGNGRLGRGFNNDGFEGYISEVIAYSSTLTAIEKNKIYSYLAVKYGFTLDNSGGGTAGDYTSSIGTLLWDADVNATYHNNVTGIGRDDDSGLDQRKSKSIHDGALIIIDKGGAFGTDDDFILWGNDALGTGISTTDAHPSYIYIMNQTWKASVAGTPGTVSVSFIYPNNGIPADFALLLDGVDDNFSVGAMAHTTGTTINGDTITFTGVTIADGMFFTLGTNYSLPAPGGVVSNLEIWLRADIGMSTTTDGAAITQWNNQSSSNYATQAGGSNFATYTAVDHNYYPSVYFPNGDNGYFDLDLDAIKNTDYNLITILERDNSNGESYLLGTDIGSGNQGLHYGFRNNTRVTLAQYGNDIDANTTAYNAPQGVSLVHGELDQSSGKTISELRNRTTVSNSHGNTAPLTGNGNGRLGRGFNNSGFEGTVSEVIAYSSTLTNNEKNRIYSYLALKYGFMLDNSGGGTAGDYTSSNGTLVWDADENASYYNDITSIGRDDTELLYQKQARTQDDSLLIFMNTLQADNQSNTGVITNDNAYLIVGNNKGRLQATQGSNAEKPAGIESRFEREWKVTNTNFMDEYSLEIEWDSVGTFDINDIRLLVDDDGDFSDATVFSAADGLTFSLGSIIIGGIDTAHIPVDSTTYFTIGSVSTDTPLPIELTSFEVEESADGHIDINWQTSSEINNDYFTIERSKNITDWEEVVVVNGAGNSANLLSYAAKDESPYFGVSYYRLKQTDFDGTFDYSEVKSVYVDHLEDAGIKVHPNPTEGQITVLGDDEELLGLKIYSTQQTDVTGMTVVNHISLGKLIIDMSGLSSGVYYLVTHKAVIKVHKQ